jgi:hypothetical protein
MVRTIPEAYSTTKRGSQDVPAQFATTIKPTMTILKKKVFSIIIFRGQPPIFKFSNTPSTEDLGVDGNLDIEYSQI